MIDALARVIATALEAARTLDEERVRAIVREELANFQARAPEAGWMTPPRAAKARAISLKRVRALIDAGRVEVRKKNPQATNPKFEVSLRSLDAALAGEARPELAKPVDAAAWAAARGRKAAP